ncbi:Response regulator of the LytR/AlgR family [Thermoplasmatales archaeon BRNA1]|nr:Response regulator of the LytR/AlgR family [Thermoplasmatales archaeon BRNA1]
MRVDFFQNSSLDEVRVTVQAPSRSVEVDDLISLIEGFSMSPISGYSDGSVVKIAKKSVIRFYSRDKRVYVDTLEGSFSVKSPLYQLEEELPNNFVRISNSEIVNIDKILRLDMNLAGTIRIHLEGDIESRVSRRYLSKVKGVLM